MVGFSSPNFTKKHLSTALVTMETTKPETTAADGADEAPHVDATNLIEKAEDALSAWKKVVNEEKEKAEDLRYYAEELWLEDKKVWASGKRKVLSKEWTVEHFNQEVNDLKKRQVPVWDELEKRADVITSALNQPWKDVEEAHEAIKDALRPKEEKRLLPAVKNPFGGKDTSEQGKLRHHYQMKLREQFKEAEDAHQNLCGYPEGMLAKPRLFRKNAADEGRHIIELVHKDEYWLSHDKETPPQEAGQLGEAVKEGQMEQVEQ